MGKAIGYYNWKHHIVPQVRPWIATKDNWNKAGEIYTLVRNPYFFKTDPSGRQLPYIDKIDIQIINEDETTSIKKLQQEK